MLQFFSKREWKNLFFLSLFFILREQERERERAEEGQTERGRERIPSRFHVASAEPDVGLELMNCEIMT